MEIFNSAIKEVETYKKESTIYAKLQENKIILEELSEAHNEAMKTIHICEDYGYLSLGS